MSSVGIGSSTSRVFTRFPDATLTPGRLGPDAFWTGCSTYDVRQNVTMSAEIVNVPRFIVYTFYAPYIAHRRSRSPPTIIDRFLDLLKRSPFLEKKWHAMTWVVVAERAKSEQTRHTVSKNLLTCSQTAAAHICAA